MEKTISVIVPVYKVEEYLPECVNSILNQTFEDFELILVDDGSPDNCGAICDEYAKQDDRVTVIHQENGGLSAARNAGIDASHGRYLTFVDSDDVIHPQMFQILLDGAVKGADIAMGLFERFESEIPPMRVHTEWDWDVHSGQEACRYIYSDVGVQYVVAVAKLYKRELFNNLRYPVGVLHEDEAVAHILLYNSNQVCVTHLPIYLYRQTPGSIMNKRFNIKRYDSISAFKNRVAFFEEKGETELKDMALNAIKVSIAKLKIQAISDDAYDQIPAEYNISTNKALKTIRATCTEKNYLYYLRLVDPRKVRIYEYKKKLKSLFCKKEK